MRKWWHFYSINRIRIYDVDVNLFAFRKWLTSNISNRTKKKKKSCVHLPVRCSCCCCCSLLCLFPMTIFVSLLNVIFINFILSEINQFSLVLLPLHIHTYLLRFLFFLEEMLRQTLVSFFCAHIHSFMEKYVNQWGKR
jgi:hypothetical protein